MSKSILRTFSTNHIDVLKDNLRFETDAISNTIDRIVCNEQLITKLNNFAEVLATAVDYNKPIYFTSIGKSVPMLEKTVATMKSLGIPAFTLDAVHMLHGDVGVLNKESILVVASKSGHTKELNATLEYVVKSRHINPWYITMANEDDEIVTKYSSKEHIINLPICDEIDRFNKVPTVSPIVFQLVLDAVAARICDIREFNESDFLFNHPGGDIGKSLSKILEK